MNWSNLFRGVYVPSADELEAEEEAHVAQYRKEQEQLIVAKKKEQAQPQKPMAMLKFYVAPDGVTRILLDWDETQGLDARNELGYLIQSVLSGDYTQNVFNILVSHGQSHPDKQSAVRDVIDAWNEAHLEQSEVPVVPPSITLRKLTYESQANQG